MLTAFLDLRNLLNATNLTRVFSQTGGTGSKRERDASRAAAIADYQLAAAYNGVSLPDSTIDLTFAGAADPRAACNGWYTPAAFDSSPDCIYLIAAEGRFGIGDYLFTVDEQTRAIDALYYVGRGLQYFAAPGRAIRLGLELRF